MHARVCFSHIAAENTCTTAELHPRAVAALDASPEACRLAFLRYELSKLRAKGLIETLPHSRRYRLLPEGYRIGLVLLNLFERIYAPLAAGLLWPVSADNRLQRNRSLTSSTNGSSRRSTPSCRRSVSRPPEHVDNREQNSRYTLPNGGFGTAPISSRYQRVA